MKSPLRSLLTAAAILLSLAFLPRLGRAEVTVTLAADDATRDEGWETLRVSASVPPALPSLNLSVQDARGGPVFSRAIGPGDHEVLFPLALLNVADLPAGAWPVRLHLEATPGQGTLTTINVPRRSSRARSFRVAVRRQTAPPEAGTFDALTTGPVTFMPVTDDQILNDPPLVFSSCDAVLLDSEIAPQVTSDRAAAIVAAGSRLLYNGAAPPVGMLADWAWAQPVPESKIWVCPREHSFLRPPGPLGAATLPQLAAVQIPRTVPTVALAVTPVAVLLLMFIRLSTPHAGRALVVLGVVFVAGAVGAMAIMQTSLRQTHVAYAWSSRKAPGSVAIRESVHGYGRFFSGSVALPSDEPIALLPVASSAPVWFTANPVVQLDVPVHQTQVTLPARQMLFFRSRSAQRAKTVGAFTGNRTDWLRQNSTLGFTPDNGVWLLDDHVFQTTNDLARSPANWLALEPTNTQNAVQAWHATAYLPGHLYFIALPEPGSPDGPTVVDLGPAQALPPATSPAEAPIPAAPATGPLETSPPSLPP